MAVYGLFCSTVGAEIHPREGLVGCERLHHCRAAFVAEIVVATLREETFLILPHPEVEQFVAKKATEHQRWLAGMRKLQLRTLGV